MRNRGGRYVGFREQLIVALIVVSALPLLAFQMFSYVQIESIMSKNNDAFIEANMVSTLRGARLALDAYESVLNQLYVDDHIVAQMEALNKGSDAALSTNQLMRSLGAACYAKEYIRSITVILPSGEAVFYDKLTGSTIRNAWLQQSGLDMRTLYSQVSQDNRVHLLPTRFAAQLGGDQVYLLHLARRAINYKDIAQRIGVIVLSIDERLLSEALSAEGALGTNILLDGDGYVLSCPVRDRLGEKLTSPETDAISMILPKNAGGNADLRAHSLFNADRSLQLIYVGDQSALLGHIRSQQTRQLAILISTFGVLALVIMIVTRRLSRSVGTVASAMRRAGSGDMAARVVPDARMPAEMQAIASQFNQMMGDIDELITQAHEASEKQRVAEIAMLEAQINPHFLYNTLDAINWMAIDENQMDISTAITSLARILRYSIDNSVQKVSVREEVQWLEQYLGLQKMRLKSAFSYSISVDESVLPCSVHKLLFQPFVENAIRHGFAGARREKQLSISIGGGTDDLCVHIEDNGRGMSETQLRALRDAIDRREEQPGHIGIVNAVSRMRMYYGDAVDIQISSAPDQGARIDIRIPLDGNNGGAPCAS